MKPPLLRMASGRGLGRRALARLFERYRYAMGPARGDHGLICWCPVWSAPVAGGPRGEDRATAVARHILCRWRGHHDAAGVSTVKPVGVTSLGAVVSRCDNCGEVG